MKIFSGVCKNEACLDRSEIRADQWRQVGLRLSMIEIVGSNLRADRRHRWCS